MISKEQLAIEREKEAEFNKLFETVISKSPFSKWYPLMIGASNILTRNLAKRVGVDMDGRPMVVYKSEVGKLMGVWATPTHKVIAQDLSQKKYGLAIADLLGFGQIKEMVKQKRAKFFDISPEDVKAMYSKKIADENRALGQQQNKPIVSTLIDDGDRQRLSENKKINYAPLIFVSLLGISMVIGLVIYARK